MAEYSIMFGLVAVAAVGALSIFGGSVSQLFHQSATGPKSNTMNKMATLQFNGGTPGGSQGTGSYAGAFNTPAGQTTFVHSGQNQNMVFSQKLVTNGSSNGVNATSVDGNVKVQAVKKTVASAQKLQDMADSLPEGPLKEWYKFASQEAFLLAGNEASLSYKKDNIQSLKDLAEPNMEVGDALYEMGNHYSQLGVALISIPPTATEQQKAEAAALVNGIMDSMNVSYSDTLTKYTNMSEVGDRKIMSLNVGQLHADNMAYGRANYTKTAGQVQAMAETIITSGAADETPAVKAGLTTGQVLDDK